MINIETINQINLETDEGKLLISSLIMLNPEMSEIPSEEIFNKVKFLSNQMFFSEESKIRKGIKNLIFDSILNKYIHQETKLPIQSYDDIPQEVLIEIDNNVEGLLNSLKKFGIFVKTI